MDRNRFSLLAKHKRCRTIIVKRRPTNDVWYSVICKIDYYNRLLLVYIWKTVSLFQRERALLEVKVRSILLAFTLYLGHFVSLHAVGKDIIMLSHFQANPFFQLSIRRSAIMESVKKQLQVSVFKSSPDPIPTIRSKHFHYFKTGYSRERAFQWYRLQPLGCESLPDTTPSNGRGIKFSKWRIVFLLFSRK